MSSFNNGIGGDHLFLQTLINRLQIRQPNPQSLDDLLFDAISNLSCSSDDENENENEDDRNSGDSHKSKLVKEESRLEKQLIRLIRSGDTQTLKPNSGQAVSVGEHHICVGNHVEDGSDYRVWEWHGHIMMFDEENGYTPEYIYGNYFEKLPAKPKGREKKEEDQEVEQVKEDEEKPVNLGLKELIDGGETGGGGRVVHRGLTPAPVRQ